MQITRNTFVSDPWVLTKIVDRKICDSFDCGDNDLNEYFLVDAIAHEAELLTQCYYVHVVGEPRLSVALLDLCNDAIRVKKVETKDISIPGKPYSTYPAVKLTRFGVKTKYQNQNIGTKTLNIVKEMFLTDNRTGCRFITVDALNNARTIKFYQRNDFVLFTDKDREHDTRAMYFDLTWLRPS
jgi:hypothetical protein